MIKLNLPKGEIPVRTVLINLVLFKVGWLAVVAGAAAGFPLVGTAVVFAVVGVHLWQTKFMVEECILLICVAVLGLVWESFMVLSGLTVYRTGTLIAGIAPYWIVAMWVLFATTLNIGLRWLRKSTTIAVLTGVCGGPLAFFAGERMGAVSFDDPLLSLVVIGIGWAVLLPVIVRLATRFDGQLSDSITPKVDGDRHPA